MNEWCAAIAGYLTYEITADFKNADVYFVQRETANREWAENERDYSKKDGLYTVTISLLERTAKYLPERRLKPLLLHQIGHALGLIDHLSGKKDAMSLTVCDKDTSITHLSDRDKHELQLLYFGAYLAPVIANAIGSQK